MRPRFKILFRINLQDEIVFVSEQWNQLVQESGSYELLPENILGGSLWNLIDGETTKTLYLIILRRVRGGGFTIRFRFRCDVLGGRKLMQMKVTRLTNGEIQFETRRLDADEELLLPRSEKAFEPEARTVEEIIVICSWCNKIKIDDGDWQEIEESIKKLSLFEQEVLPQASHGMCDDCYQSVSEKFKK